MTTTTPLRAEHDGIRLDDSTTWPLPDGRSIVAIWNVADRWWDVLELGWGQPRRWGIQFDRADAERIALQARKLLLPG